MCVHKVKVLFSFELKTFLAQEYLLNCNYLIQIHVQSLICMCVDHAHKDPIIECDEFHI
jgi:hypothetical protein